MMLHALRLVGLLCLLAWAAVSQAQTTVASSAEADADGFVDLFAGSLANWVEEQHEFFKKKHANVTTWSIQDGVVSCDGSLGNCGFLRYKPKLGDFTLRLEYRLSAGCNSGVGIRAAAPYTTLKPNTLPSNVGLEVQLLDDAGQPAGVQGSGSFYNLRAPSQNAQRPAGQWCNLEIRCQGDHVRVVLNGVVVQDVHFADDLKLVGKPLAGYLSLQNHGHDVQFRHVRLKTDGF